MKGAIFNSTILILVISVASAAVGFEDDKEEAIRKDRKQIEGVWRIVAMEINGEKAKDEDARKLSVVNGSDGTWTLLSEGKEVAKGTSTIDPTKKPKTLDFTPANGDAKGKIFFGVYELGEKTRKMCFAAEGKPRPKELAAPRGSDHILVTFERESPK